MRVSSRFGGADRDTLAAMLDTLVHRGPDDGHLVTGRGFALGARRLSIMDLAGGRQPLSDESGRIWAAQNGEIYNFPELRPALCGRGHHLRSHCDTEVLPHLYEEHGAKVVEHLRGMFALAIWDSRKNGRIGPHQSDHPRADLDPRRFCHHHRDRRRRVWSGGLHFRPALGTFSGQPVGL